MSNCPPNSEPRSNVILRHTADAIDAGVLKLFPFSAVVAERYLATTAERYRVVGFKELGTLADQALPAQKHNHKLVDRYFRREVKTFPADLEEAWLHALPEPYRHKCLVELASRGGYLPLRDPIDDAPTSQAADLSDVLRAVGETAIAAAPIFADGQVTRCDAPHLPTAMAQIRQLMTAAAQLYHRLKAVERGVAAGNVTPLRGRGQG